MTFPAYALDLVCGEEASEDILKNSNSVFKSEGVYWNTFGVVTLAKTG